MPEPPSIARRPWCVAACLLIAASVAATAAPPDVAQLRPTAPQSVDSGTLVVFHYHRPAGDYDGWNLWVWQPDAEGKAYPFTGKDAFGVRAQIKLPERSDRVFFIIRKGEWESKDVQQDRSIDIGPGGTAEAWLVAGEPRVYTDPRQIDFTVRVRSAFLDDDDLIRLTLSQPVEGTRFEADDVSVTLGAEDRAVRSVEPIKPPHAPLTRALAVRLREPVSPDDLPKPMRIALEGVEPVAIAPRGVLESPQYHALDARLGPHYTPDSTVFRTWSPVASAVDVLVYEDQDQDEPTRVVPMTRGRAGVWEAQVPGDLHGVRYHYRFDIAGRARTVTDIHTRAATADSGYGVVLDLDRTDPEGWDDHRPPRVTSPTDEVIYEIHVRDYSIADPNVPAAHRGKFLGLTHPSPAADGKPSTSLTHLRELGVTAVHLMPIQDYTAALDEYNWGYWTALFNVPEAQYGTDPHDPAQTIRELKQTIKTLQENDIRVILDVVYNHTSSSFEHSPFDEAVPWYYFRTTIDGRLRNESGTGNAFADERAMARKYIVDSLRYWVEEYKVDGFRFDLLGMHHPETVRQIVRELRDVRPDLTLYGEPWTGGGPTHFGKGAQRGMTIAVFNDHLRNAVRGDLDGTTTGFATGPGGDVPAVKRGVMGAIDDFTDSPIESVNYVSAHDNRTFFDKLRHTHPDAPEQTLLEMHKLAHGIVLTSQGIAFLHGGADFARTKGGHHNSYNAGDRVNRFDWPRKQAFEDVHEYIRGLIHLRRAHPALRMSDAEQVRRNLRFLPSPHGTIVFALDGRAVQDPWRHILVAYNGEPAPARIDLPAGRWRVVVDHQHAGTATLRQARGEVTLPPYSTWVAYRD